MGVEARRHKMFSIGYINFMIPSNQVPRLRQACRTVDGEDCQRPYERHHEVKIYLYSLLSRIASAWERPRPLVTVSGACYPEELPGVRAQLGLQRHETPCRVDD